MMSDQAQKKGEGTPLNIPGISQFPALGKNFHVFGPAAIDPIDAEPITITDFNGFVGLAYINGTVTEKNKNTDRRDNARGRRRRRQLASASRFSMFHPLYIRSVCDPRIRGH
jgi:hypothetical protein